MKRHRAKFRVSSALVGIWLAATQWRPENSRTQGQRRQRCADVGRTEKHRTKEEIIEMSKEVSLVDIHNDLETSNRLMILSLVRQGVAQKDLAATVGVSEAALSKMFSKGLLKRVAHLSKLNVQD